MFQGGRTRGMTESVSWAQSPGRLIAAGVGNYRRDNGNYRQGNKKAHVPDGTGLAHTPRLRACA